MPKILYSPGYGAGWTTWNRSDNKLVGQFMVAHPGLIEALEQKPEGEATGVYLGLISRGFGGNAPRGDSPLAKFLSEFRQMFPDEDTPYLGGADDLEIYTIEDGQPFRIEEYDGNESVVHFDPGDFFVFNEQPTFELPGPKSLPETT
jgi:hypothetical protein